MPTTTTTTYYRPRCCTMCGAAGPFFSVTGATDRVSCGHCLGHVFLSRFEVRTETSVASRVLAELRRYRWEFQTSRPWISANHLPSTGQAPLALG